jgi:hypothetical protein
MHDSAIQILIQSNPLWQQHAVARVRTVYTVMGRQGKLWQTILTGTNDIFSARRTMDAANNSLLFDRVVIAAGRSVSDAPPSQWETVECALPVRIVSEVNEFAALLSGLRDRAANMDNDRATTPTPVAGTKESCAVALVMALGLAVLHGHPIMLGLVGFMAFIDTAWLADKNPITSETAQRVNAIRHWGFAVFNGVLMMPLFLKVLLQSQ